MATMQNIVPVTLQAAGDLSASGQFRFVTLSSGQVTTVSSAGANAIGVLLNKPTAAGQAAEVALTTQGGICKVVAGAATTAGAQVQSDNAGRAVDASTSDVVLGYFIEAATAAGQVVEIILGSNHINAA